MFYISDINGTQSLYSKLKIQEALDSASNLTDRALESIPVESDLQVENSIALARGGELETSDSIYTNITNQNIDATNSNASSQLSGQAAASLIKGQIKEDPSDQSHPSSLPTGSTRVSAVKKSAQIGKGSVTSHDLMGGRNPRYNPYLKLDQAPKKREQVLLASQIMSSPVATIGADEQVEKAWDLFHEKSFRHLPVISKDNKLVGILSDHDFLHLWMGQNSKLLTPPQQMKRAVKEIMTTNVLTARPGTKVRSIAEVMFDEHISALPIVDEQENLIGILTSNDILRTLVNSAPLELWT